MEGKESAIIEWSKVEKKSQKKSKSHLIMVKLARLRPYAAATAALFTGKKVFNPKLSM